MEEGQRLDSAVERKAKTTGRAVRETETEAKTEKERQEYQQE